jgi:hypothetical protein
MWLGFLAQQAQLLQNTLAASLRYVLAFLGIVRKMLWMVTVTLSGIATNQALAK